MCPYLSSPKIQSLCRSYNGVLMCPSLQERQDYCFGKYKSCPQYPIYSIIEEVIKDIIGVKEEAGKLLGN